MYRFFYYDSIIPAQDCEAFIQQYENKNFIKGEIKKEGNTVEDKARNSNIFWVDPKSPMCRAIWSYMVEANKYFNVNLNQLHEQAQLSRYTETNHYAWHIDTFFAKDHPVRNLSAILQLSSPENYKGGELQLFNGEQEPETMPIKNQGSLVFFRSNEWHRITQIESGTRYSLVFWA